MFRGCHVNTLQVHEAMANCFPQLMSVLGPHSNDNEIRILLKSFLANVGSSSAVIRRTTATILTVLVINGRNPKLFTRSDSYYSTFNISDLNIFFVEKQL